MIIINKYEEILSGKRPFNRECDNEALFMAYAQNKISDNERLDLCEALSLADIKPITDTFRDEGINEFTVSFAEPRVFEILEFFGNFGFHIAGIIWIYNKFSCSVPAVLMKAEGESSQLDSTKITHYNKKPEEKKIRLEGDKVDMSTICNLCGYELMARICPSSDTVKIMCQGCGEVYAEYRIESDSGLRECPYCSSDAVHPIYDEYTDEYYVWCDNCKGSGPIRNSREKAINAWNMRGRHQMKDPVKV